MLVDFFFKKYAYYLAYTLFYINNITFSEKYFVEYMFFRFNKYCETLMMYVDYYANEFTYAVLAIAVFSLVGIFIFFLVVA